MQVTLSEKVRQTPDYYAYLSTCRFLDKKCRWDVEKSPMVKTDLATLLEYECVPEECQHCMFDFRKGIVRVVCLVYKFGQYHILKVENWAMGSKKIQKKMELYQNPRKHKLAKISLTDEYIEEMGGIFCFSHPV